MEEKLRTKNFGREIIFLSGLIGKFHINFTVIIVFENSFSQKKFIDRFSDSFSSYQAWITW